MPYRPEDSVPQPQDPAVADQVAAEEHAEFEVEHAIRKRLTDRQAIAVIGGYVVLRQITTRAGIALLPALLASAPWAIPLFGNIGWRLLSAGSEARGRPLVLAGVFASSMLISMLGALVFYWAGYRFGPQLAERAAKGGSSWGQIWNPKRIQRAHVWLDRWGLLAVAGTRALRLFDLPVALVAGSSRMHLRTYALAQLIGASIWASTIIWLGTRAGDAWPWLPERIKELSPWSLRIGLVSLLVLAVAAGVSRQGRGSRASSSDGGD